MNISYHIHIVSYFHFFIQFAIVNSLYFITYCKYSLIGGTKCFWSRFKEIYTWARIHPRVGFLFNLFMGSLIIFLPKMIQCFMFWLLCCCIYWKLLVALMDVCCLIFVYWGLRRVHISCHIIVKYKLIGWLLKLILLFRYADFLCRLNDDRNVRALFERALSLLPPEESVEVTPFVLLSWRDALSRCFVFS